MKPTFVAVIQLAIAKLQTSTMRRDRNMWMINDPLIGHHLLYSIVHCVLSLGQRRPAT